MKNGLTKYFSSKEYKVIDGKFFFLNVDAAEANNVERPDDLIFKLKFFLKKHPKLFLFLYYVIGTFVGTSAKKAVAHLGEDAFIINLGSGVHRVREGAVNLDIAPHEGVDVIADVHRLPFKNDSADAVVAECLLEHLKNPEAAVKEIYRVLKPGGMMYVSTPFIIGYHSSPDDYQRWTTSGLRELLKDFKKKEFGILVGPTNAMTYILREWLATALSFNSRFLYQFFLLFFMVLFTPLNWLDFILKHYTSASSIAHIYYFIGTK